MLQKQPVNINFSQGLDTKTDPFQVPIGKFASLVNSVFTKGGLLQKRNGFGSLPALPDKTSTYATTFNGDLTTLGTKLEALSSSTNQWFNKGPIQPLSLSVLPLVRNNLNQSWADSVTAANGLMCTVYTEVNAGVNVHKYVVADSTTGQNIIEPTVLPANATYGYPKVFIQGIYFVVVYTSEVVSTYHIQFITISTSNPTVISSPVDITTSFTPSSSGAWDAAVLNGELYVAWNGAGASGLKMAFVASNFAVSSTHIEDAAHQSTIVSVAADSQNQVIWASYYNSGTSTGYSLAVTPQLALVAGFPVQIISSGSFANIASTASSGLLTLFGEVINAAGNYIDSLTVVQSTAVVSSPYVVIRSLGLASKPFVISGTIYFLGAFSTTFQPTYFLVNASLSTSAAPNVVSKIAYENGGGYLTTGLPSVTVSGMTASVPYLYKDLIEALHNTNSAGTAVTGGVYSQTGINLVTFDIGSQGLITSEIGTNLNITGGFLWAYDGYAITEQGFHVYPEPVTLMGSTSGGVMTAQEYVYQVTYEWTDNQGNAFRSAGSIPVSITTTGSTSSVTLTIPTLRITAKTQNPVKIVIYRWSTGQEVFYQTTSITSPILNDPTVDTITYVDTLADSSIQGNNIIYTTGGVIEDTGAPSSSSTTLFDDRLWLVDAEDPNLLWYSKQVIEATPVEMSDLLTIYVAPTIGAQGSTGPITALGAMDDKLIIFKQNAIYYINGSGPDNTGSNSQYSQPIFVTSSAGCTNPRSVVLTPTGLMFQSDKGIWILGRDLSTNYIGAPVENFNSTQIQSALGIPATNQDRFTASDGTCLMYDYYYSQWGTFTNLPAQSSTIYQGYHTYISPTGAVFQETPNTYLDGTTPVLLGLTTGWLNLAGLQGYQRAYFFYLLGVYYSPFKLICSVAYDYDPNPIHSTTILPVNFNPAYGGAESNGQETVYGNDNPYGGQSNVLNWRVFLKKQRCDAIQITLQEVYDPSFGVVAGEGLSLSGIQLIVGIKNSFRPMRAATTAGTS